jgi:hypothetical protein
MEADDSTSPPLRLAELGRELDCERTQAGLGTAGARAPGRVIEDADRSARSTIT